MQAPATEMFNVKNNIAPEIVKELFEPKMSPTNASLFFEKTNLLQYIINDCQL